MKNRNLILYLLRYDLYPDKLNLLLFTIDICYLLLKSYTKTITTFKYYKKNNKIISNDIIKTLNSLIKDNLVIIKNKETNVKYGVVDNTNEIKLTDCFNTNEIEIIELVLDRFINLDSEIFLSTLADFDFYKNIDNLSPFDHDKLRNDSLFKQHIQQYLDKNKKNILK
jgi:hypothetical protein